MNFILNPPPDLGAKLPADAIPAGGWVQALCPDGVTLQRRGVMPIPYTFESTFGPIMRAAAKAGMEAWTKASGGSVSFVEAKPTDALKPYVNENYGIAFSSAPGWQGDDAGALAITRPNDTPDNVLVISLVQVNTGPYDLHQGGLYYVFPVAASKGHPAKKASYDINLVLLHELGHCLGFGHSGHPDSIMYPYIHPRTGITGFSADDLVGLATVYPVAAERNA